MVSWEWRADGRRGAACSVSPPALPWIIGGGDLSTAAAQRTRNPCSPAGSSHSTSTESTMADRGPSWNQATMDSTAGRGPSNTASTRPSGRLRTHPATPRLRARPAVSCRKKTPCTSPEANTCARAASPTGAALLEEVHRARRAARRGRVAVGLHLPAGSLLVLPLLEGHEDVPRLRSLRHSHDPPLLQEVHQPPGPREADLQLALQHRRRAELRADHQLHRLAEQLLVLALPPVTPL